MMLELEVVLVNACCQLVHVIIKVVHRPESLHSHRETTDAAKQRNMSKLLLPACLILRIYLRQGTRELL